MTPLNAPELDVMLPVSVDTDAIYDRFRAVLDVAPMSKTELAEEVGVAQATVSRWAAGDARPSLERMLAAVAAVEDRIAEIQRRAEAARDVLEAAEEALEARRRYEDEKTDENRRNVRESVEEVRRLAGSGSEES